MEKIEVKVGPKYQVVIPRKVREVIPELKPGVKVSVEPLGKGNVKISVSDIKKELRWLKKNRGFAKKHYTEDPAKWIRRLRDEEWD